MTPFSGVKIPEAGLPACWTGIPVMAAGNENDTTRVAQVNVVPGYGSV